MIACTPLSDAQARALLDRIAMTACLSADSIDRVADGVAGDACEELRNAVNAIRLLGAMADRANGFTLMGSYDEWLLGASVMSPRHVP